ncbi:FecR family protein [Sinomicrobium pectinilyticum]|uniref:FecR family protein n=1 Tax=Sinomicrobium pectinilyticum TaxID=1084421 RepID=A0A3N0E357_SINP1|nr:FecR family protein [Sinomicrobium pectinilyticum]RNL82271.1 FecR family protein [Sinomicrobium pectinilyticum]
MTENEIKTLMKKYQDGTISHKEELLLEEFDGHLLYKREKEVFNNPQHKKRIGRRLGNSINDSISRSNTLHWTAPGKIAASVIILLGLGLSIYLKWNTPAKTLPITILEKSTDWGQKLSLTLTDGTEVRLNSGSTIKFPERFTGNTREVELTGEAFFNVARNPKKPFIIKSDEIRTTVLGTSFNINTFPENEEITVTVATGKVKVASDSNAVFLGPEEQGVFDKKSNRISRRKTDIRNFIQWKDGIIHFEDTSLFQVSKVLGAWYGVTFVFAEEELKNCHLTAIYNNEILSVVLESIKYAKKGLQYEYLDDNKVLIKGRCTD